MKLGICTIQRDRSRWIAEWCAFHYLVGFRRFCFFAHRCTDETYAVLQRLRRFVDIAVYTVPDETPRPQLASFKFAYDRHGHEVDWMAFVDGDEFVFPAGGRDIADSIASLDDGHLDAVGVYWACFGSAGHIREPEGLITENFRWRAFDGFRANRHVKSIVRGGLGSGFEVLHNAHVFRTPKGTFDELRRPIVRGLTDYAPSYRHLRMNHYVCQSLEYFRSFKQRSGAADAGRDYVRPDDWWSDHDRNDVHDSSLERFYPDLRALVRDWSAGEPQEASATFPMMTGTLSLAQSYASRNGPCPCGSGLRHKHCHGRAAAPASSPA
jgi:hypothetical protein